MLINGFLAGLAIVVGAGIVLAWGEPSERVMAVMLGLAAGVMAAAAGGDLLPAAVALSGRWAALGGFIVGGVVMQQLGAILDRVAVLAQEGAHSSKRVGYLVFAGVALHDILEGMAVAVGYGVTETLGLALAAAIGIHHMPEGMAMAAPLKASGTKGGFILGLAALTALMTPLGVCLGLGAQGLSMTAMGVLLAAAGGAMAALAFFELCPEAWRYQIWGGRLGFLLGLFAMLVVCLKG